MIEEVFKSYDIRGLVDEQLTPELVENIGRALAEWLPEDGPVVVGYDMRPSSISYKDAMVAGLTKGGRDVVNIGLVSTDMMYFAVGKKDLAGGVMITASHNPSSYNGLKISRDKAIPVDMEGGLAEVKKIALDGEFEDVEKQGEVTEENIDDQYLDHILSFVEPKNIESMSMVVDAGNGMMGEIFPKLQKRLKELKVEELYFEPDGTFPNHEANPMKHDTLTDLSDRVKNSDAKIGIAFDGDGDRVGMVDENGEIINGSDIFMILSAAVLDKYPNSTIVHELRMSKAALEYIKSNGGSLVRTKVGNPLIKTAMRENNATLGGETTGHYVLADNYNIDSGLLAALLAIDFLVRKGISVAEFIDEHHNFVSNEEVNFEVSDKQATIDKLANEFSDHNQDKLDGLTIEFESGAWINIRPSNTEPLLRFNAEAPTREELEQITNRAKTAIGAA